MATVKKRPLTDEEKADAVRLKAAWKDFQLENTGATQEWLANVTGLGGQSVIGQYLNGYIQINLKALLSICQVIGADPKKISPSLASTYTSAGNLQPSHDRPAYKVSESPAPIPITINSDREAEKLLTPPPEGFTDLALLKDAIKGAHMVNVGRGSTWTLDQIAMLATFFYKKWKMDGVITIPTTEECELAINAA